jgi:4-aminobutyrate aminotransferase-like enzyme
LFDGLKALKEKYACIGDVRGGHGLMLAIEMVSDRATKAAPDKAMPGRVQKAAYEAGAMVRVSGPNIILSPPLVITDADAKVILSALDKGFAAL